MKEWLNKAREIPVRVNKNLQKYEAGGVLVGLLYPPILGGALMLYGLDRVSNIVTRKIIDPKGEITQRIYGEPDTITNDFKQALDFLRLRFTATPRMARAAA